MPGATGELEGGLTYGQPHWATFPGDERLSDVHRREFLAAAAAVPTAASIDGLDSIASTTPPSRVGATEIAQIRDVAISVKRGDMRWGGGFGFDAALVETRRARDLLDARCSEQLRPDLLVAVGWLAANTGFMAFDSERYRDAARLWDVAARCAEEAGNWSLHGRVVGSMARQAAWLDRPGDAVGLVDGFLERGHDHLVPTERAMLWALKARASAQTGDVATTEQAVGAADHWFAQRDLDESVERPWIAHYSHAHHFGDTGMAWNHLAVAGQSPRAVLEAGGRHRAAADGHGQGEARSYALSLLALATLDTRVGDVDRAVQTGHLALAAAGEVRSSRVRDELTQLHQASAPHNERADVAELREEIATTLLAA
jgi:hypothetical protein